jgi:trimeric autotransporter adhesin
VLVTTGGAAKLAFTTQPSGSTGGVAFGTPPVVKVQDLGGNTVTGDTSSVTLAITNPGGATLACSSLNPLPAVGGVAAFIGCKIDRAAGYTLTATDGSLTSAVSSPFAIAVGGASKLAFTTQPSGSTGGVAFGTPPVVKVQDLGGNTVTGDTSSVTLAITNPAGATLACTSLNPLPAVGGVAAFVGCKIDRAAGYTLTATDGSLTSAVSSGLTITVGSAVALRFLLQPVGSFAATNFPTQPLVRIVDLGGNTVTSDSSDVLLAITAPGAETFTCSLNPRSASSGVAAFSGCQISLIGTYTLTATDGSLTAAVSNTVSIV